MSTNVEVQLFLDCDGVLADFDSHFLALCGEESRGYEDKYGAKAFWKVVQSDPDFFYNLPLMPGAQELYDAVKHLSPPILTGVPNGNWAQPQKLRWRDKHFPDASMITCPSRDKKLFMVPGKLNIIIDDWTKHQKTWEDADGVFIVHTSAAESLAVLRDMGVL